ncbi:ATP-binding protein [Streptomyces sp. YS-3]|uniref:ATP-binding protein n=1 Tax=Streptomyces sp. YS-3 TaxID=3381352 RepID=UPI003862679E
MARDFLTSVQAVHGLPVSARAMGIRQLVASELVTNARKYAPGPSLLDLEICDGAVQISVWDSSTTLPSIQAADPQRIGQDGLEIAMAVSQTFCVHRQPVGKPITAVIELADDPGEDPRPTALLTTPAGPTMLDDPLRRRREPLPAAALLGPQGGH